MTANVLDASAFLALLRRERGADVVEAALVDGAAMTAVNFGEVATYYARGGADEAQVRAMRRALPFPVVPVDDELALRAGLLASTTKPYGLSLGDRICLAYAARLGLPALTSDRKWSEVAEALGVEVRLIR